MKKLVALFALLMMVCGARAELYPATFIVDSINSKADVLELVDPNGFIWEYEGVEEYQEGDIVAAIMDDSDTEFIFDDTIVKIRYAGFDPDPIDEWGDEPVRV